MYDWFENAPEWCTVVIRWDDKGWTIYLETDEEGKSGNLLVVSDSAERGFSTGPKRFRQTGKNHIWWMDSNQDEVVARRGAFKTLEEPTPTRYLTEEEVVLLHDLGLLEEALEQQGVEMQPRVESYLTVKVENSLTGDIEYLFDEEFNENDSAATVEDFFDVVETAYHKLGFENDIVVTSDNGFIKVFRYDF